MDPLFFLKKKKKKIHGVYATRKNFLHIQALVHWPKMESIEINMKWNAGLFLEKNIQEYLI